MRLPVYLVVSVGVVFTSLSSIIIRLSSSPPLVLAAYRMWFATILLAPMFIREIVRERRATDSQDPPPQSELKASEKPTPPVVVLSVISGVFLSLHFATWISSLSYTSVASSTLLVSINPVLVAIAGFILFRERLSWKAIGFMVAAVAGGAVLVIGGFGSGGSAPLGNLLAFLGALTVSGYMLIGRVVRQHLSLVRYTFIVYCVSAVMLTVYAILAGNPLFGYTPYELLLFLALAIFCTLLGHSLYNWALKFASPTVVSTIILGEPVIAGSLAALLFAEVPTVYTFIGGFVVLVSIFLFVRESNRTRRPGVPPAR